MFACALTALTAFCHLHEYPLPAAFTCGADANRALVAYIQYVYEHGGVISSGTHAILAVQTKFRQFHGQLKEAWDSIDSWKKDIPLRMRVPMPHIIMLPVKEVESAEQIYHSKHLHIFSYGLHK